MYNSRNEQRHGILYTPSSDIDCNTDINWRHQNLGSTLANENLHHITWSNESSDKIHAMETLGKTISLCDNTYQLGILWKPKANLPIIFNYVWVVQDNTTRGLWPIGRIIWNKSTEDNQTQVYIVKTREKLVTKPAIRIAPVCPDYCNDSTNEDWNFVETKGESSNYLQSRNSPIPTDEDTT